MPDISMCKGDVCPLKERCYRYMAKPTPGSQSFLSSLPFTVDDDGKPKCEFYWPTKAEIFKQFKEIEDEK